MQLRHVDRRRYFHELAKTSESFFVDYVSKHKAIKDSVRILEIGCGEGGNLLPFARLGAVVVGVDISEERIEQANTFFSECNQEGTFLVSISFNCPLPKKRICSTLCWCTIL